MAELDMPMSPFDDQKAAKEKLKADKLEYRKKLKEQRKADKEKLHEFAERSVSVRIARSAASTSSVMRAFLARVSSNASRLS